MRNQHFVQSWISMRLPLRGAQVSPTALPGKDTLAARIKRFFLKNGTLLLMALPALLLLFVFNYVPMFGIIIAFKHYTDVNGIFGSPWVGLKNFEFLFKSGNARQITYNTIFMNALFIVVNVVCSITVALGLNEISDRFPRWARFYQSAMFLPYFISYIIIAYFAYAMLNGNNGLVNNVLASFHLPQIAFFQSPQYWPFILTLVNTWKSVGFWSIIYLASILAINPEYFEAARVDGATKWQQIRYITLPLLTPIIIINILLALGRIFYADFGLFYQVTQNNALLYPTTLVIDTYVYNALTNIGDVGMAAAAGFYQSMIGFILVLGANWIVRRYDAEKALF